MNETTLTQLKIIVERAVRPVRASTRHKRKVREELLAHVTAVFNEESAKLGEASAALAATAQRFGEPAELAHQLQQAVPRFDRLRRIGDHVRDRFFLRPGESRLRCALRQTLWFSLAFIASQVIGLLGFGAIVMAINWMVPIPNIGGLLEVFGRLSMVHTWVALCMTALAFVAALIVHGTWHEMHERTPRSWLRLLTLCALACAVGPSVHGILELPSLLWEDATFQPQREGIPAWVIIGPYCLLFAIDLRWRFLNEPDGRSWLRTVLVRAKWGVITCIAAFVLSLAVLGDLFESVQNMYMLLLVTGAWLLPFDLCLTAPRVAQRWREEREWANLRFD